MVDDCEQWASNNDFVQCILKDDLETLKKMENCEILQSSKSTVFYVFPKQSPLHVAALLGKYAVVSLLLSAGVEVNVECPGGRTPLFWAVTQGHVDITCKLLDAGGDLTLLPFSSPRRTALHWAANIGHYDMARFLIEHVKVDVAIRNYTEDDDSDDENAASGGTALDEAAMAASITSTKAPLVMLLLRALAQCGGPVPRAPCVALRKAIGIELEECLTDDDREFTVGLRITRVRHWREAAALQRRLQVRQSLLVSFEYEPEFAWAPPPVLADDAEVAVEVEAAARCERGLKRQRQRKDRL
jgi:hypothetical protein